MKLYLLSATALCAAASAPSVSAQELPGTLLLDVRARYEHVEQAGKDDAEAATVRTRLGWQSPERNGFSVLAEIENVADLTDGLRNTSQTSRPGVATINDEAMTELQRLELRFAPNDQWSGSLGRQHLGFDGSRFIGTPGWRQDKNSHDALALQFENGPVTLDYVYHWQLNRGPGDLSWDTDAHLFHAGWAATENVTVSGFAYLIDLTDSSAPQNRSNSTVGAEISGTRSYGETALAYSAMIAQQSDYGSAQTDFDLTFYSGEASVSRFGGSLAAGYVNIEGDGSTSIANPLAANHSFQGWADTFSGGSAMAGPDGLEDLYFEAAYGGDLNSAVFTGWSVFLARHEFSAERTGVDLGEEWDFELALGLGEHAELAFQIADYDGPGGAVAPADRTKQWVVLSYKY
ncbi:hypothetical protein GCM10011367_26650 [Marinicauda pacifica]|uniref:Alginate export domain-containing protein n=1 Tax=Marinicauda pacifica TaxID=1133559 RepID=A0A4S2H7P1_9PROT|nr:hypothetical protein [Marinicauda pacifica]TGY91834.1 hypothetical protein E5162_13235 [Marinicauda pacifica]GGE50447.1 hypothetical protein GCM10011367_26650 [Marinicauda pacifica]